MTNEQAVLEAENKASELKKAYTGFLTPIVVRIHKDASEPTLEELLACQQFGAEYFNYVESFVGTSGLLGAHANGKWVTGFAETCHSVLDAVLAHHDFLNSHSGVLKASLVKPDVNSYANMQRMTKEYLQKETWQTLEQQYRASSLPVAGFKMKEAKDLKETPKWQLITGLVIGVLFALVILVLVVFIPNPTLSQFFVFRGLFAISLAAVAAIIPGLLNVESRFNQFSVKATGAIAVFILVWMLNPPALIGI
ncbi:hypothetical protein [Methylotenera sp. G11]|uniref:hypothetical protein n=1 Tax=Methylotenera sp. G11 TaxID=1506585 RepID=UPI0006481609|nr:hypothetical protein [Methylotenera sp. G11]